ncbi:hypothetical protein GCM10027290_14210 [Micromonospora sonneratiae]|uniref:VOC family protein n=2 Tax=Micromonospora sonneratiae TaxID=1184706 RepID=A0ABW3YLG3_9ACTN
MISYRDIEAARHFLAEAFDFRETAVHTDAAGTVQRVDLARGTIRITIGRAGADTEGVAPPGGAHLRFTIGNNHWEISSLVERATAAGARILHVEDDEIFGDCLFTAEDPEGNRWTFAGVVALTG